MEIVDPYPKWMAFPQSQDFGGLGVGMGERETQADTRGYITNCLIYCILGECSLDKFWGNILLKS